MGLIGSVVGMRIWEVAEAESWGGGVFLSYSRTPSPIEICTCLLLFEMQWGHKSDGCKFIIDYGSNQLINWSIFQAPLVPGARVFAVFQKVFYPALVGEYVVYAVCEIRSCMAFFTGMLLKTVHNEYF